MNNVGDWLENIGMGKYVDVFRVNDLNDMEVVSQLTAEELERDLKIKSFGDRKKTVA